MHIRVFNHAEYESERISKLWAQDPPQTARQLLPLEDFGGFWIKPKDIQIDRLKIFLLGFSTMLIANLSTSQ